MLKLIELKHFKSHSSTQLALGNLTLLCGQNGVGKSSVIQSLLLLRQTYQKNRLHEVLELNGDLYEMGSAKDIIYQYAQEDLLGIKFITDTQAVFSYTFLFNNVKSEATFLDLDIQNSVFDNSQVKNVSLFNEYFQYLSAGRLAPQESYPKDDYEVERNRQISIQKGQGELVAHFLSHFANEKVATALHHPSEKYAELLAQTTAWEREISENVNVKVDKIGTSFKLKYNFNVKGTLPTEDFDAKNVGFGLTYTLPIIVAILAAKPDSLLLIENPEAHLHPRAQSKLTELICLAAQSGVQIILETHSDHIINGVLVQAKKFESYQMGIDRKKVKIYYFQRNESKHASQALEVEILENAIIRHPPKGFFDQIDTDLKELLK